MEHEHPPKPPSTPMQPLFLGLDLSTQQLKVLVLEQRDNIANNNPINDDDGLRTHSSFTIHFDSELPYYRTRGGVHAHAQQSSGVVTAPVLMWVEALQRVFEKMKRADFPFHRVVSISGAAQVKTESICLLMKVRDHRTKCERTSRVNTSLFIGEN